MHRDNQVHFRENPKDSAHRFAIVLALSCMLVACLAFESRGARASHQSRQSLPNWVMDIPLWKVLPTKHFATLGKGVLGRKRWAVFAYVGTGSNADEMPCIRAVTLGYKRGFIAINDGGPSCGGLAPPRSVPVTTEHVFTNTVGVVVGMTLSEAVSSVSLDFSAGADVQVLTKRLNPRQASNAKVRPFRYVAIGARRKACLEAFSGTAKSGALLFQTPSQECVLAPE